MKIWLCESIGKEELIKGNWRESNGDEKNHLGGYKVDGHIVKFWEMAKLQYGAFLRENY